MKLDPASTLGCMCRTSKCERCGVVVIAGKRGPAKRWCSQCKPAVDRESKLAMASATLLTCGHCKASFSSRTGQAKYCSRRCQQIALGRRIVVACKSCGTEFACRKSRFDAGYVFCRPECVVAKNAKPKHTCRQCGKVFKRTAAKGSRLSNGEKCLYCSKACYGEAIRCGKQKWCGLTREDRDGRFLVRWFRSLTRLRGHGGKVVPHAPIRVCIHCNAVFFTSAKDRQHCSRECAKNHCEPRSCLGCGTTVMEAGGYKPRCDACRIKHKRAVRRAARRSASYRERKRMANNHRKRCRKHGGYFNPQVKSRDVFARDNYRCHVCRKKTHAIYSSHDPLSATIDHHPIPLSKGGDHDWHNVRCACARCNSLKSNKWSGQRRLAFGPAN